MTEEKSRNVSNNKQSNLQQQNQVRYSGFWVRGAAFIIDGLVIGFLGMFVTVPIGLVVGIIAEIFNSIILNIAGQFIIMMISLILSWGYFIFMTYKYQATLGKMAVGVKVVSENQEKLSLNNIVLRETIGKIVSAMIFDIGYIMAAFTEKKQGLHDIMVHSTVVYSDATKGPNTAVVAIVYSVYAFLSIMLVSFFIILFIIVGIVVSGTTNSHNNYDDTNNEFNQVIDDFYQS